MNFEEIKNISKSDRDSKILELRKELFNLRFKKSSGQLSDSSSFKKKKRDIARLLTLKSLDRNGEFNA